MGVIASILQMKKQRLSDVKCPCPKSHSSEGYSFGILAVWLPLFQPIDLFFSISNSN